MGPTVGFTETDLWLIVTSLAAGVACRRAVRSDRLGSDPSDQTAVRRSWEVLGGTALVYSVLHFLRTQSPIGIGDVDDDTIYTLWMEIRMGALVLVVLFLLLAVGTIPALAAVWRSTPRLERLEAVASILAIGFVAFLVHNSTAPVMLVDVELWGLLWLATFAGGIALWIAGLILVWAARPRRGAELVIALAMCFLGAGAVTTGYGGTGWPWAWCVGWLILAGASWCPMSPVPAGPGERPALIGRAVRRTALVGALASVAFSWLFLASAVTLWVGLGVLVVALGRHLAERRDGHPGWRDWRQRLRGPGVLLTVLGLAAFWLVSQTLVIGRPNQDPPEMAFAVRGLYPEARNGFRIDVVLDVSTGPLGLGCRNPVDVTAVISGTPEMWKQWKQASGPLADTAHFGIAIASSSAVRDLRARLAHDPEAPRDPLLEAEAELGPDPPPPADPTAKPTFRVLDPSGRYQMAVPSLIGPSVPDQVTHPISGSIENWRSSWIPLVVRFKADWVLRRSLGTCYVLLPNLTGTQTNALEAAVEAAGQRDDDFEEAEKRVASSHGYVRLDAYADLLGEESSPRPAVFASGEPRSEWTCSSSPLDLPSGQPDLPRSPSGKALALPSDQRLPDVSSCGGFAVLSTVSSQLIREFSLITIGVLLSMIIEIAYSEVRGRRS